MSLYIANVGTTISPLNGEAKLHRLRGGQRGLSSAVWTPAMTPRETLTKSLAGLDSKDGDSESSNAECLCYACTGNANVL